MPRPKTAKKRSTKSRSSEESRRRILSLRVTVAEYRYIQRAAGERAGNVSAVLREALAQWLDRNGVSCV